jgi:hypothetical protein
MQLFIKTIAWIVLFITLPGISSAANKKNTKKTGTANDDITWSKEYFNGVVGTTEKTTATGDKITLESVVRSDLTMYELLNNIRGYSKPGSFFVGRSVKDSKGEFDIQINTILDSDRFENAADFNKLFYKKQAEVKYPFTCNSANKTCEFDNASIVLALNDHYLENLEGKPGEIESLSEKHVTVMPITTDLISIAIENRGKLRSLFCFQYNDGEGEFNAKGIEFLKKYFPLTPIIYKGRYHFPEETGWEPKELPPPKLKPESTQIIAAPIIAAQNANLIPLKLFWSNKRGDNFSTATDRGEQDAINASYRFARIEGYIYSTQQPGTVPLKLYWNATTEDYFSTATTKGEQDAINANYRFVRIEGFVYAQNTAGTVPLKLYWNAKRKDNCTIATQQGESAQINSGYSFSRIEGYIFPAKR